MEEVTNTDIKEIPDDITKVGEEVAILTEDEMKEIEDEIGCDVSDGCEGDSENNRKHVKWEMDEMKEMGELNIEENVDSNKDIWSEFQNTTTTQQENRPDSAPPIYSLIHQLLNDDATFIKIFQIACTEMYTELVADMLLNYRDIVLNRDDFTYEGLHISIQDFIWRCSATHQNMEFTRCLIECGLKLTEKTMNQHILLNKGEKDIIIYLINELEVTDLDDGGVTEFKIDDDNENSDVSEFKNVISHSKLISSAFKTAVTANPILIETFLIHARHIVIDRFTENNHSYRLIKTRMIDKSSNLLELLCGNRWVAGIIMKYSFAHVEVNDDVRVQFAETENISWRNGYIKGRIYTEL